MVMYGITSTNHLKAYNAFVFSLTHLLALVSLLKRRKEHLYRSLFYESILTFGRNSDEAAPEHLSWG